MPAAFREPHWLEEAARIGADLCTSAIRHDGRCSWLGRSFDELEPVSRFVVPTVAALGPDLYDGTAGVGLFLGQLYASTGDKQTKTIALEAITHALEESSRSASPFGFFSGRTGIAFAAARLAALLDTPALGSRALALRETATREPLDNASCDVISGLAGTILGLLVWPDAQRDASELVASERLGQALAAAATAREDTWAWSAARAMGEQSAHASAQPMTGLSHGAAGMGVVLLDLAKRVDQPHFAEVARGAFAYEARVFSESEGNWPDFRARQANTDGSPSFALGWCHGAPGIALARRHALSIEEHPAWARDWQIALASSRRAARDVHEPGTDASLCHGLAGCVEPLFEASRRGPRAEQRKARNELARIWAPLCERFGRENAWPSGLPSGGPNPSLMVGTAGIGWTMLRMHDPKTPSVLLPLLDA